MEGRFSFDTQVVDHHPTRVRLLAPGDRVLRSLLSRALPFAPPGEILGPSASPAAQVPGSHRALRLEVSDRSRLRVGWYIPKGGAPIKGQTLEKLRSALDQPPARDTGGSAWVAEAEHDSSQLVEQERDRTFERVRDRVVHRIILRDRSLRPWSCNGIAYVLSALDAFVQTASG